MGVAPPLKTSGVAALLKTMGRGVEGSCTCMESCVSCRLEWLQSVRSDTPGAGGLVTRLLRGCHPFCLAVGGSDSDVQQAAGRRQHDQQQSGR